MSDMYRSQTIALRTKYRRVLANTVFTLSFQHRSWLTSSTQVVCVFLGLILIYGAAASLLRGLSGGQITHPLATRQDSSAKRGSMCR